MLSSMEIERELGRLEDLGLIKTLLLHFGMKPVNIVINSEFLPDVCHKLFWIGHFCEERFAVCLEEKKVFLEIILRTYIFPPCMR